MSLTLARFNCPSVIPIRQDTRHLAIDDIHHHVSQADVTVQETGQLLGGLDGYTKWTVSRHSSSD